MKYNAPHGEKRDPDVNLKDVSYDGMLDGGRMEGGLGQLVDGLYGDDDYQKQLQGENSGILFISKRYFIKSVHYYQIVKTIFIFLLVVVATIYKMMDHPISRINYNVGDLDMPPK